jgi:multiple sugar transport system permease protein
MIGKVREMLRRLRRIKRGSVARYVILAVYIVFTWFPLYWLFLISVRPDSETAQKPPLLLTARVSLARYIEMFTVFDFGRLIVNSVIVATVTTGVCLAVGILASYFLCRSSFSARVKDTFTFLFFAVFVIPPMILLTPDFLLLRRFHLFDTYEGLILPYTSIFLPFAIIILKSLFENIPREAEEAAMLDGLGSVMAFIRVTLPSAVSGIVSVIVIVFVFAWSEFVFALILTFTDKSMTLPIGVWSTMASHELIWGNIGAGAVMAILPPLIVGFFVQKPLAKGLGLGA